MTPLFILVKGITEYRAAAILREHVSSLKSTVAKFEAENRALKNELAECQLKYKDLAKEKDMYRQKCQNLNAELKKAKRPYREKRRCSFQE